MNKEKSVVIFKNFPEEIERGNLLTYSDNFENRIFVSNAETVCISKENNSNDKNVKIR